MAFKPFDTETQTAIRTLKSLIPSLVVEDPKSRIKFVTLVFKYDLYSEVSSNELLDDFDISGRHFDTCLEMGDGDTVVHGLIKQALDDYMIKWNISAMGDEVWNHWYKTFLEVDSLPVT